MARDFITRLGVCVAAGFLVLPAQGGDRKPEAATEIRHAGMSTHNFAVAALARSTGDDRAGRNSMKAQMHAELPFVSVSPFETRSPRVNDKVAPGDDRQKEKETSSRPERKTITLFRFDSKLGSVAVQPVVGGVNGAQFSVGF